MDKIYMEYVANLFGLELGEPFTLVNSNGDEDKNGYTFTEKGLKKMGDGTYKDTLSHDVTLANMFRGYYDIKKLPWKPVDGETYFMPYIRDGEADYEKDNYLGIDYEEKRYEAGLVCKTKNEAIEKAEKMLAVLKED